MSRNILKLEEGIVSGYNGPALINEYNFFSSKEKAVLERRFIQRFPIRAMKQEKNKTKRVAGSTILAGLSHASYSQVLSHYCLTRELLSAMFPSWTGTFLFIQPGGRRFP